MFNLVSILDIVRTARDTAAAARDDWNDKASDTDNWHLARQAYFDAEGLHAASIRRLLRAVKILSRTDTLYLYLNFFFLTAEQQELLNQSLRDNRHDRLLNTEEVPSNDFVALANAWKIERDRFSAGQELFDISQHHDNIDAVIKNRADQLHPRGWGLAIRAFRITRETIAQARSLRDECNNLTHEEREQAERDCESTAIDAIKSRAEARLIILSNKLDRFLAPRINHAYLLDALMESILPVEVRPTFEDFDEDGDRSADHSIAGTRLNQPEDSESFQKRLEEAREVVEALRTFVGQPKPESNKFCVPVTTMIEGEQQVVEEEEEEDESAEPEPQSEAESESGSEAEPEPEQEQESEPEPEAESDEEPLADEESERLSDEFQDEVPTMTAEELKKLFNQ
jgi:hypothetical protein